LASGAAVVLTRPADGLLSLNLISTVSAQCQAEVKITTFTSENGSVDLDLLANRAAAGLDHSQTLAVMFKPNEILTVWLRVPPLQTATHYNGRLVINAAGQEPVTKAISVVQSAPEQGTLVLDHTTVSRTVSRPFWPPGAGGNAVFSVVLHEKTDKIQLRGISARLEGVANSPDAGFDLHQNIVFALKSPAVKDAVPVDLGLAPSESDVALRTIKAGEQAGVEVTLKDLNPGDYAATLRFTASNSTSEDAQKLQLNLHVRSWIGWAVLWLFGALVISFFGTKVLVNQQQRAILLEQIRALEPEWLSSFLPIPPVVWVRAVLHQAKKLSARHWLTSPDLIASNVNSVKNTVSVLETAHKLRVQLESNLDPLLYKAAILAIDPVIARIETTPLSDAAMQSINTDLNVFNDWLDSDKFASAFWKVLKPWADSLLSEMGTTQVGSADSDVNRRFNELRDSLQDNLAAVPQSRTNAEAIYRLYAQLRLLWDERESDLAELVRLSELEDIDAFFKEADQLLWDRLRNARPVIRLAEDDTTDDREAYEVLKFRVELDDPLVKRSYLFRYKVAYHWKFTWTPESATGLRRRWRAAGVKVRKWFGIKERLASEYPQHRRLVGAATCCWYFPRAGHVGVFVELHYHGKEPNNNSVSAESRHFDVDPSGDFGRFNILRRTEAISWIIAAIIAMVSGLSMFYFKGTSWGTYQDYLTLILWGIGVDQGKNFLQALQASSPQSVKLSAVTPEPAPASAQPAS
jgi:hypothetical protein